jgi:hypothetical protein
MNNTADLANVALHTTKALDELKSFVQTMDKIFSSNQPVAPSEVKNAIDFIKDTLESRLSEFEESDEIKKQIKERENNKINALGISIVSTLEGQNRLRKI